MVLSKEDRIALLAKAREAKAKKRSPAFIKEEETEDDEEETPVVNVPMPEPEPPTPKKKTGRKAKEVVPLPVPVEVIQIEEEPLPVPKKRVVPNPKWLKQPKTEPEKVCCDKKLTKEEPLIEDKPQVVAETIVVPPQKEIKKVRKVRASTPTRTLELTPPRDIVDVIEELKVDNTKYLPKIVKQAPPPSAPISIRHQDIPLRLFDY
jgi:hypothetical protein